MKLKRSRRSDKQSPQRLGPQHSPKSAKSGATASSRGEVLGPDLLRQLQGSVGNRAVDGMIQRQELDPDRSPLAVQRDQPNQGGVGAATAAPSSEWESQRTELEGIRARAATREFQAEGVVGLAAEVLDQLKTHMGAASDVYGKAYGDYAKVVAAAQKAAKNEEEWIEIGVGILLAVTLAAGPLAGTIAGVAEGLEAATGLAVKAGEELIVATGAEAGKGLVKKTGLLEVVGSTLQPGGLKPEAMKLALWQKLVDLHASVLKTAAQANLQSMIASGSEYAIGEVKAQVGGGMGADMSVADLHNLIGTLASDDSAFPVLDTALSTAFTNLQAIKAALGAAPSEYGRQAEMERDIWVLWIADLSEDEAKTLDIDAIEDHMEALGLKTSGYGGGGYLGVDTGIWTTKNDCIKMINSAKGKAEKLKEQVLSVGG